MDSIHLRRFSELSFDDQKEVLRRGRPKPPLTELKQQKGINNSRTFQNLWYSKKEWLCGCGTTGRLFCYSCLLFACASDSIWVKDGFVDLNNLPQGLGKHERSIEHYNSQIALKTFKSVQVNLQLEKQNLKDIEIHNKKVKENRDILQRLICAICFLIKQNLPFCGKNNGNYIELLKYTANYDVKLAQHLQNSPVFSGSCSKIQEDLVEAINILVDDDIRDDILRASFVSIEVDESPDSSGDSNRYSTVLRYMLDSQINEAFVGFSTPQDKTTNGVAECIVDTLERYDCAEKLVAQTYDGAVVPPSSLSNLQVLIRQKAPAALLTNCYAHNLSIILTQSAKFIPECAGFFKTCEALSSFLQQSTRAEEFLNEIVRIHNSESMPIRWDIKPFLIRNILEHHDDLCKLFYNMNNNPNLWDSDSLVKSTGFYSWLTKVSTCFLLIVYNEIFIKTDSLFYNLQLQTTRMSDCIYRINNTVSLLEQLCNNFDDLYTKFEAYCSEHNLMELKLESESVKEDRVRLFGKILVDVLNTMKARFADFAHLNFISLVQGANFDKLSCQSDNEALTCLENNYGHFFDLSRLKADLAGIYHSEVFRNKSIKEVLEFILDSKLSQTFPEVVKLLQLVLTIPATSLSVPKSQSALRRIQCYTEDKENISQKTSSLAFLSIEKERLIKIEQDPTYKFYEKVTAIFATKNEKNLDFIYK